MHRETKRDRMHASSAHHQHRMPAIAEIGKEKIACLQHLPPSGEIARRRYLGQAIAAPGMPKREAIGIPENGKPACVIGRRALPTACPTAAAARRLEPAAHRHSLH